MLWVATSSAYIYIVSDLVFYRSLKSERIYHYVAGPNFVFMRKDPVYSGNNIGKVKDDFDSLRCLVCNIGFCKVCNREVFVKEFFIEEVEQVLPTSSPEVVYKVNFESKLMKPVGEI